MLSTSIRNIFCLACLISFLSTAVVAQSYSSPESVEFDYANNRWFISNNGNGQILTRNSATGALAVFATGIPSGPHGLEIVGDTLYACDGSTLKAYEIQTATLVFNINLGASFLNGITHDNSGNLYITDFSTKRIYRFNTSNRTYSVFVSNTGSASPNGIVFDDANNRCVYVNWGSNAPIKAVDLSTGTVSTLATTNLGSCDGITKDNAGNYYVSSWSTTSKITRFNNDFTASTAVVTTGLSNPADIFYNVLTDTLGVPNSGTGNNTAYYYFGSTTGLSNQTQEPSPFHHQLSHGSLIVRFNELTSAAWQLVNQHGQTVQSGIVGNDIGFTTSLSNLPNGNYLIRVQLGKQFYTRSFVWIGQ
ncbi:MAG: SMP-30/gluconolactonase/LRE family protein [Bacteroidota bacterium]|jgi:hypothetical protein